MMLAPVRPRRCRCSCVARPRFGRCTAPARRLGTGPRLGLPFWGPGPWHGALIPSTECGPCALGPSVGAVRRCIFACRSAPADRQVTVNSLILLLNSRHRLRGRSEVPASDVASWSRIGPPRFSKIVPNCERPLAGTGLQWIAGRARTYTWTMRRPVDTSPAAWEAQLIAYRGLASERKLELCLALSDDVREVSIAGIRARHPGYSRDQARHAMLLLTLGAKLYRQAWPSRPPLEP